MTNSKKTDTRTMRRDKKWLRSPDQRKRMKIFQVEMIQRKDGSFHILGGGASAVLRTNAKHSITVPVDVRDLATEMRMNGVTSF
jgi:hypothetical protein